MCCILEQDTSSGSTQEDRNHRAMTEKLLTGT